jgi:hypothetical protein
MNAYTVLLSATVLFAAAVTPTVAAETLSRAAGEPAVTQTRPSAHPAPVEAEASITQRRAFDRVRPEDDYRSERTSRPSRGPEGDDKELIRSPGPASSIELVPEEAESRCRRGEAHCTSRP